MAHPQHPTARPFIKWAGGKGQLLKQYEPFLPQTSWQGGYFEPFLGSGAVFFHLRGRGLFGHYRLGDGNRELVGCYLAVRDQLAGLVDCLAEHYTRHGPDHYYRVRQWDREPSWEHASPIDRAARLIYLNKTCYNGLWRVNRQGQFNTPLGRYPNPRILDESRLQAASCALQNVELAAEDFAAVLDHADAGDFVYFDPPYVPVVNNGFTHYSALSFGEAEQRRLADTFAALDRQGCRVMLSNSDTPLVRELYREFRVETVTARRMINSAAAQRGPISEVVVMNY